MMKYLEDRTGADRTILFTGGKQPGLRTIETPILPQMLQQHGRKQSIAVFPPLALLHADLHPLTVDIRNLQIRRLADLTALNACARFEELIFFSVLQ